MQMRKTMDLDSKLETKSSKAVSLAKKKLALANRFQSLRPAGYFADDYGPDNERMVLESAMGKVRQTPGVSPE
jgi:hypothetical protein